ncbi:MAG TPA: DNA topoisomerase IB [Solirubrobacteraceae bacterium]|jgi:DNA topoisomerase IB|nr:DNA topoisomerase IB [Solirubrobacteraceae bacterium]
MPATSASSPGKRSRPSRLRRSDCSGKGIGRVGHGRGFSYQDPDGNRLRDSEALLRIKELAIPPAWEDVWICTDPFGHLQATGVDAAGRKQYLYHPRWREMRDRKKFAHMVDFAHALPGLRRRVLRTLRSGDEPDEARVLALAIRLLDVGLFRVGSEQYADDEGGVGLATVLKNSVTLTDGELVFDYLGKGGVRRVQAVQDSPVIDLVSALKRRRSGGDQLLAYKEGRRWHDVRSEQINEYLKGLIGDESSAKDFRTWNATVLAAVSLAADGREAKSAAARKRAVNGAVRGVADVLGNTPAVARRSYIDPRVFDRYLSGWTIGGELDRIGTLRGPDDRRRARLERAVLDLLDDDHASAAVERFAGKAKAA